MSPAKRRTLFERLRALDPHPKSELDYATPFELLVAVVLSAQATDKGVNKATAKLFPVARTPAAFARLGVDGLIPYISSIGLFRNKAKSVVALSEALLRDHDGRRPVFGGIEKFQTDPYWRDLIPFHEYFHGDNGARIGARHQTGWAVLGGKVIQTHRAW